MFRVGFQQNLGKGVPQFPTLALLAVFAQTPTRGGAGVLILKKNVSS
jgi:hypothetical protein